eukprot:CAMPEP_0197551720 /NCGR_PEP_ID=MMETSP1320-20131121/5267_1 /TAXON_ID=91990 /ORGANISM="Bolidomonas sp., Strain RCC2347" /LENGTH=377 /DNA_ID=CAMNT_0043112251 /DNA_START=33 /DNA_END=1166 /DNA_ORIENTATION=+
MNAQFSNTTKLDLSIQERFLNLPNMGKVQAEYVWLGGGLETRCKTRTLDKAPDSVDDLPVWNYDGSSTGQAPGEDSEVLLKPCAIFNDPFRGAPHILVMCSAHLPDVDAPKGLGGPIPTNTRDKCLEIMEKVKDAEPWFGIEQEYTLFEADGITPFGWPKRGMPLKPQGPYYCSVGAENAFGRPIVESHYRACIYAGIQIAGINGEVMPGQWEYQVGPCTGIDSGDHLWMSRYILGRVCEQFGVVVSFDPKPIPGDWNGAGCHTNFSTKAMREDGGYDKIIEALERLGAPGKQEEHIAAYDPNGGADNARRLTGLHETASIEKFTYGVANRGCSARIPRMTEKEKKGYFEDRRPASNMDPYVVTGKIVETCVVPDYS